MFKKFLQNPQENTCARASFLIKLQASALKDSFLNKKTPEKNLSLNKSRIKFRVTDIVKSFRTHLNGSSILGESYRNLWEVIGSYRKLLELILKFTQELVSTFEEFLLWMPKQVFLTMQLHTWLL